MPVWMSLQRVWHEVPLCWLVKLQD